MLASTIVSQSELLGRLSTGRAIEPHFRSVRPSHMHSANGAASSGISGFYATL
jgi:hypothetical protein